MPTPRVRLRLLLPSDVIRNLFVIPLMSLGLLGLPELSNILGLGLSGPMYWTVLCIYMLIVYIVSIPAHLPSHGCFNLPAAGEYTCWLVFRCALVYFIISYLQAIGHANLRSFE
jgi:hypothetical protein